jgi:hypothetical protein
MNISIIEGGILSSSSAQVTNKPAAADLTSQTYQTSPLTLFERFMPTGQA